MKAEVLCCVDEAIDESLAELMAMMIQEALSDAFQDRFRSHWNIGSIVDSALARSIKRGNLNDLIGDV